jgi:hypothetical protein
MRLVYDASGEEVKIGDRVPVDTENKTATVTSMEPPHKPSSVGFVTLKEDGTDFSLEFYVPVIDATWIEREDRI